MQDTTVANLVLLIAQPFIAIYCWELTAGGAWWAAAAVLTANLFLARPIKEC